MRLAIDIGNTLTKVAIEDAAGALQRLGAIETKVLSADASALGRLSGFRGSFAAVASVVPEADLGLKRFFAHRDIGFRWLDAKCSPGMEVRYETPETVGADRLANGLYLSERGRFPAAVVDFGTATKLDVLDRDGAFLGGAILPSARMMLRALADGTALLPEFSLEAPSSPIGRSTSGSLQTGTVLALARSVDGLLSDFEEELGTRLAVTVTGGSAALLTPVLRTVHDFDADLTLKGLLVAARRWAASG